MLYTHRESLSKKAEEVFSAGKLFYHMTVDSAFLLLQPVKMAQDWGWDGELWPEDEEPFSEDSEREGDNPDHNDPPLAGPDAEQKEQRQFNEVFEDLVGQREGALTEAEKARKTFESILKEQPENMDDNMKEIYNSWKEAKEIDLEEEMTEEERLQALDEDMDILYASWKQMHLNDIKNMYDMWKEIKEARLRRKMRREEERELASTEFFPKLLDNKAAFKEELKRANRMLKEGTLEQEAYDLDEIYKSWQDSIKQEIGRKLTEQEVRDLFKGRSFEEVFKSWREAKEVELGEKLTEEQIKRLLQVRRLRPN